MKDNKEGKLPALATKLKIEMFFLNEKNALRLNGLLVLNEKAYDFLDVSSLNAGGHAVWV